MALPKWSYIVILVLVILSVLFVFINNEPAPAPEVVEEVVEPVVEVEEEEYIGPQVVDVVLQVNRDGFNPEVIEAKSDDVVKLQIVSTDGLEHSFTMNSLGINEVIPPNTPVYLEIPVGQPGNYRFVSFAPSNPNAGNIQGTLRVLPIN